MLIHSYIPKRKEKKPTAKQRALKSSWEEILKKYDVKPQSKPMVSRTVSTRVLRENSNSRVIPSLDTGIGNTSKPNTNVYSGDAVIGISVLHKSNAVPVFSKADIIDIAKMRRG